MLCLQLHPGETSPHERGAPAVQAPLGFVSQRTHARAHERQLGGPDGFQNRDVGHESGIRRGNVHPCQCKTKANWGRDPSLGALCFLSGGVMSDAGRKLS